MKKIRQTALTIVMIYISGCASIFHGTEDKITINSLEKDTIIKINNIPRGKDVAELTLERGVTHTITASKEGCSDTTIETGRRFDHMSLVGVFLDFGLISIPVDFFSGAAWKTSPTSYTVTPNC